MVIPSPDPNPAIAAMRQAIEDAAVPPRDVDYLNAHATSTPVGDIAEVKVLETVFGADLPKMSVSSTKGMTGHLLTAGHSNALSPHFLILLNSLPGPVG